MAQDELQDEQSDTVSSEDEHLQSITESLYKQNLELAVKNKTLSLLGELYEISIQEFRPEEILDKMTEDVRAALEFELVSFFMYYPDRDFLEETGSSQSARTKKWFDKKEYHLEHVSLQKASTNPIIKQFITYKKPVFNETLEYFFAQFFPEADVRELAEEANIQSAIYYPFVAGNRFLGILILGLNRPYTGIPEYEQSILGSIANVISIALDKSLAYIALEEANEKLKSLDKLKTEFISIASHQLRTPLTAIKGYVSLLLEGSYGALSKEVEDVLNKVYGVNERLSQLVEDLLNVSRIEAGRIQFTFKKTQIIDILTELYDTFILTAKRKGLELSIELPEEGFPEIIIDGNKVKEVISNLIDNALKYTPKGKVTVRLGKTDSYARITVSDTGIGMDKDIKAHLFEKFMRSKETSQMVVGGAGLGLYVGKNFIDAQRGHLWAESEGSGQGSTFIIELPLDNSVLLEKPKAP